VEPSDAARATGAAVAIVTAAGLRVDEPIVLQSSNTLALRLLPCDVVARVAPVGREVAAFEVELARRLADAGCPTAVLDPRIPPQVHEREGFAVTLWTHYGSVRPRPAPEEYADALARLHAGMRRVQMPVPHFTDRVRTPPPVGCCGNA